jgi:hypothetical protein
MKYTTLLVFLAEQPLSQTLWHLLATQLGDEEAFEEAVFFKRDWNMIGTLASGTPTQTRAICVEARTVSKLAAEIVDLLVALIQREKNEKIKRVPALPEKEAK